MKKSKVKVVDMTEEDSEWADDFENTNHESLEYFAESAQKPQFTGWFIPAIVVNLYEERRITEKELILLAQIESLSQKPKEGKGKFIGCYASNRFLAQKINYKNPMNVSRMISHLKEEGLIVEYDNHSRKRYLFTSWTFDLMERTKAAKRKSQRSRTA